MALLKLLLAIYILTLIFSMAGAFIRFVIDVWRWHDKEEPTRVTKSQFEKDLKTPVKIVTESVITENVPEESEVKEDAERDEHNTPAFFRTRSKS